MFHPLGDVMNLQNPLYNQGLLRSWGFYVWIRVIAKTAIVLGIELGHIKVIEEEKIRIVLEGMRAEDSVAALCRREGINSNVYYRWSKDFLEAGRKRLASDIIRQATSDEVKGLRKESLVLKEALAEPLMEYRLLFLTSAYRYSEGLAPIYGRMCTVPSLT